MQLHEIVTLVNTSLRRPDVASLVETRVRSVVTELHSREFFPRDRYEEIIQIPTPGVRTQITLPDRWRKFATLRPMDINQEPMILCKTDHQYFKKIDAGEMFKNTINDVNVYYVAGNTFSILCEKEFPSLYVMYFKHPDVMDLSTRTWITDQYYQLIIDYVLASIWTSVGDTKKGNVHKALAQEQWHYFSVNHINEDEDEE